MPFLKIVTLLTIRINDDVADDATLAEIKAQLPLALQDDIAAYYQKIQKWKSYAVLVNAGQPNEELTRTAFFEIHRHDIGKACSPQREI